MANKDDIGSFVHQKILLGPSVIFGVTVIAGQNSVTVRRFLGGSLEIGGSGLTWNSGFLLSGTEALSFDCSGTFYMACTGNTATVFVLQGRTHGFGETP